MIRLWPIYTLLLGFLISSTGKLHAEEVILSISPESCVAKNGLCQTTLEISWKLIKPENICIKIERQVQEFCFEQSKEDTQSIALNVDKPVKVILTASNTNKIIASAKMNVFMQEYKKRKRQRHAWSILR